MDSVQVGQCLFDVCADVEVGEEGANSLGDVEAGAVDRLGHVVQGKRAGWPSVAVPAGMRRAARIELLWALLRVSRT